MRNQEKRKSNRSHFPINLPPREPMGPGTFAFKIVATQARPLKFTPTTPLPKVTPAPRPEWMTSLTQRLTIPQTDEFFARGGAEPGTTTQQTGATDVGLFLDDRPDYHLTTQSTKVPKKLVVTHPQHRLCATSEKADRLEEVMWQKYLDEGFEVWVWVGGKQGAVKAKNVDEILAFSSCIGFDKPGVIKDRMVTEHQIRSDEITLVDHYCFEDMLGDANRQLILDPGVPEVYSNEIERLIFHCFTDELDLSDFEYLRIDTVCDYLSSHPNIHTLTIGFPGEFSFDDLLKLGETSPSITTLRIAGPDVSIAKIRQLAKAFPNLKTLNFQGGDPSPNAGRMLLSEFTTLFGRLKHLKIHGQKLRESRAPLSLPLTKLNVYGSITKEVLWEILLQCHQLKKLHLPPKKRE